MQPPKIDKRTYNEIIEEIKQKLPYYVPFLKFDEAQKDATGALIKIFAKMHEGTLKNLNGVPEKNYLAFLNMLGAKILPSEPARVPLTFKLSKGTRNPVFIEKGTKVSGNPGDGGSPVVFETENSILAVPSKLQSAYCVSKEKDYIAQIPKELLTEDEACAKSRRTAAVFDFKDAGNLQKHVFYIGDNELFNFCKSVTFKITAPSHLVRVYEQVYKNSSESPVKWYYYAGEAEDKSPVWKQFDSCETGETHDCLLLKKDNADQIGQCKINGVESRWIKCEIDARNVKQFTGVRINPADIRGEWVFEAMGPDKAFYNSIPLKMDKDTNVYPFGQTPRTNDTFYMLCNEALAVKEGELTVSFNISFYYRQPKDTTEAQITAKLSWEYWNGKSWTKLKIKTENNLDNRLNNKIKFTCPEDIESTSVNGQKGLWIRVRIASGDYGREVVVQEDMQFSLQPKYKTPCLTGITVETSHTKRKQIDELITFNNLDYYHYNRIRDKNAGNIELISIPENSNPAFYLSFDRGFEKGPVSIFFSMEEREYTKENMPRIRWEYCSQSGQWKDMDVACDGTQNLTKTGTVVFSMPSDFALSIRFGTELYWIRAVDINGKYAGAVQEALTPFLKGIYLNATWASQWETFPDEMFSSSGTHSQEFTLSKKSVTYHEIWINELSSLSEAERQELSQSGKFSIDEVRDSYGETKEFWVRWNPVQDILNSGPSDRCYEMDPAFGRILFGDGHNGAIPDIGINNIKAVYKAGGGLRGNIGTAEVKTLNSSISFVEGVFNPEPSKGGFETETMGQMLKRAPKTIRNRGRAITVKDFEELATEASRSIARVKCLQNMNDKLSHETGGVTLVVLPQSADEKPLCSLELKRRIEEYISGRTSDIITFPRKFRVINPGYIEISVKAEVKVTDIEMMQSVEKGIISRLSVFLNPLKGGARGEGWDFGRMPYFSDFYALLERIPGVDYVEDLSLVITEPGNNPVFVDAIRVLDLGNYSLKPYALVSNGKHSIALKI